METPDLNASQRTILGLLKRFGRASVPPHQRVSYIPAGDPACSYRIAMSPEAPT